jgi:mono/diheme cytochrome c family protein
MRIVLALALLLAYCGCSQAKTASGNGAPTAAPAQASPLDNGRSIFQTGKDVDGVAIVAAKRPLKPYCAVCHGTNGAGGKHFADGAVSADLRHKALVTDQTHPYTLALLERAISTGIDNDGKPLDRVMPHWRLSKRDLHDVALYVFTQLR